MSLNKLNLLSVCLAKPLFIGLSIIGIRKFINPIYCSPQCAIRLVNESDPRAFSVHPYWKDLSYDDSCAGETLLDYRQGQFSQFEGFLQTLMTNIWNGVAILAILYQCFNPSKFEQIRQNGFNNVKNMIVYVLVGFFAGTLLMMHCHFEQDVTFLTGAIIHHAEESSPGINLEKATISQGYLICGIVNRFFYSYITYQLIQRSQTLSARINPIIVVSLLNLIVWYAVNMVKHNHPWYHEVATPEMKSSRWYSQESRAYHHVILHHDTGESFSGDPFLDPVFDYQLYAFGYLHNKVFSIELGSAAHHAFNCVFDAGSGLLCSAIIYGLLHTASLILPNNQEVSITKTKSN